jgi:hypothetical protein
VRALGRILNPLFQRGTLEAIPYSSPLYYRRVRGDLRISRIGENFWQMIEDEE